MAKKDIQFFEVVGKLRSDCNKWNQEVYIPAKQVMEDYLVEEFGTTKAYLITDITGKKVVRSVLAPKDGRGKPKPPYGMKLDALNEGYMMPDRRTLTGRNYIDKFQKIALPFKCESIIKEMFNGKDFVYEGNGYWRSPFLFQFDVNSASWYFSCDVQQAIYMQFDLHPNLVALLPIEVKRLENQLIKQKELV